MSDENTTAEPTAPQMDPNPLNDVPEPPKDQTPEQVQLAGQIEEYMLDVIDPELGVNIVDLGLLYGMAYNDEGTLLIDMTLTTAACPLTDVLEEQVQKALDSMVDDWRVNWVWMPPWGPNMITEEGREMLQALGFAV